MATYQAQCQECGAKIDYYAPIDKRDNVPPCPICRANMQRLLDAPKGFVDTPAAG